MNRDLDKRIIRTKTAIRKAFNELVQKKDISSITVSELVKAASITRSTFYMYYGSVIEVRNDIEQEIMLNLEAIMDDNDWLKFMVDPYPLLSSMTQEIIRYDEYNRYILLQGNSSHLFELINMRVIKKFLEFIKQNNVDIDGARGKYIAMFIAAGIEQSFTLWYNHQSTLTLEELCMHMSALIGAGLKAIRAFDGKPFPVARSAPPAAPKNADEADVSGDDKADDKTDNDNEGTDN